MKHIKHKSAIIITLIALTSFLKPISSEAANGDTTIVHGFSSFLHQNCNTGKGTFAFPSDSVPYYRILLKYQLICPSFGCDIYDRIATLKVERGTGVIDSTLTEFPSFTVNGSSMDSLQYMTDTSYTYFYDSLSMALDSIANPSFEISFYTDSLNPSIPTTQIVAWPAYYNSFEFDSLGNFTDSTFVTPDSVVYVQYDSAYVQFEVKERIEIARSITP